MLQHLNAIPAAPRRVVVLGASGFVGGAIAALLEARKVAALRLGRPALGRHGVRDPAPSHR